MSSKSENANSSPPTVRLKLLATSDLHMNLMGYDYYSDRPEPSVGLTRTATLIRAARKEAERQGARVLLFDNGDSLQGTPFGDCAAEADAGMHPLMRAFECLGYDAVGLGNHDFSFGLERLSSILAQSPCPVLCSNLHCLETNQPWQASTILEQRFVAGVETRVLQVGVFSVLPPQTTDWEAHLLDGRVTSTDILETATATVRNLKQKGCDVIVALAHSGLAEASSESRMENVVVPLAAIEGIDAVVAGHTHLTLPGLDHNGIAHVSGDTGLVHGKPVVMPGSSGSHLGVIDLTLSREAGEWRVAQHAAELRPICSRDSNGRVRRNAPEDPELVQIFKPGHGDTLKRMHQPVGRVDQSMHSYFSFCAADRGLALVAAAQMAALRPFLTGLPEAALPMLSAVSPAKFGGRAGPGNYTEVPAGAVSMRHIADLCVFPNELRAAVVTGAQLREWLEMSACLFNQVPDGSRDIDLIDPSRAGHNFDVIHGVEYMIDLTSPPRFRPDGGLTDLTHRRIRDLVWNGSPVGDRQRFVVALNNYRFNGGGHFSALSDARGIDIPPLRIQRILKDYVEGRLPIDPLQATAHPWRFAEMNETSVILKTGPDALRYLEELSGFEPVRLGVDPGGFLCLRLSL